MILIPSAILLAAVLISCETTQTVTGKDFVDVLKQKLRRNNDDYDQFMQENSTSPGTSTLTRKQENVTEPDLLLFNKQQPPINVLDLRRNFNEPKHVERDISVSRTDLSFTVSLPDTTNSTTKKEKETKARPVFRNDHKLNFNKEKMEKFKKFMSKNKNLFSEYLNKKKTAQTVVVPTIVTRATPTPPTPPPPPPSPPPVTLSSPATVVSVTMRSLFNLRQRMSPPAIKIDMGNSAAAEDPLRVYGEKFRMAGLSTPRGEELDLAPAKGPKIHIMRLKGRLCGRNVMQPEGPKYDSKGKMYLGEYMNKYGRDYANTRRPKLLLPRCCNCCKKSVLGCE